jgi:GntR family transcriptional regulator
MKIIISNSSPDPIYEQVTRQIKGQIISGELREGDPLPSIRKGPDRRSASYDEKA